MHPLFSLSLSLSDAYCAALVLAAAAVYVWLWGMSNFRTPHGRLPPGPRGLPLVGHLHVLGSLPHLTITRFSKTYGPLMSLRLGSVPLLVASSPDMAKLVLHTHDRIFAGRPQNIAVTRNAFNSSDIVFSQPGPYWKFMRQLCFTEFFSAKRLDYFAGMRREEMQGFVYSIFADRGTPVCIRDRLHTTISNLISRMTMGRRLQEVGWASKCLPTLEELFHMTGMINVSDFIPLLGWMDVQGLNRRSREAARISNAMFQEVIDRRRRGGWSADDPARDFLDVLLKASLNSKDIEVGDEQIRAIMMDMFVGGTHTTTTVIECALGELLANPKKMTILKKEIEQVVGHSRLVEESDLPNLPYLHAVVNESFRLHPITPLLAPRTLLEPCQISNYYIPKNTHVYVNVWTIQRDPNIWDNPLDFSPERFLDSNIDVLSQQCKFLPFGAGRRLCPGMKLGLLNVHNVVGSLIHAFSWETSSIIDMDEKFGLTTSFKNPVIAVPTPKLPNHLFESISPNQS